MIEIDRQKETELPLLYLQTFVARTDPRVIGFGYLQKNFFGDPSRRKKVFEL